MKPTYSELQDYLSRQFCMGCQDRGENDEGCESCPVGDVPTEPYPDKEPAPELIGEELAREAGLIG